MSDITILTTQTAGGGQGGGVPGLPPIAPETVLGNSDTQWAVPTALTMPVLTDMLTQFNATAQGVVPPTGGVAGEFLRSDGVWAPAAFAPIVGPAVMGNPSPSGSAPTALTPTQFTAMVNLFTSTLSGTVPASGGGTLNFLRADGVWTLPEQPIPPGTVLGNNTNNTALPQPLTPAELTPLINIFTATSAGTVPASGGGTSYFLRSDGTWATTPANAPMPPMTVTGNPTPFTQAPVAITQNQLTQMIELFSATNSGAVPASGGGTNNFLRADGVWTSQPQPLLPPNTVLGNAGSASAQATPLTQTTLTSLVNLFTPLVSGAVPASGGGTEFFLRADGTWADPPEFPMPNGPQGWPIVGNGPGSPPSYQQLTSLGIADNGVDLSKLEKLPGLTVIGNANTFTDSPQALAKAPLTTLINVFTQTLSGAVPAPGVDNPNFLLDATGLWRPLFSSPTQWGYTYVDGNNSPYAAVPTDRQIRVNGNNGPVTLTLPVINDVGVPIIVVALNLTTTNTLTINGQVRVGPGWITNPVFTRESVLQLVTMDTSNSWYLTNAGPFTSTIGGQVPAPPAGTLASAALVSNGAWQVPLTSGASLITSSYTVLPTDDWKQVNLPATTTVTITLPTTGVPIGKFFRLDVGSWPATSPLVLTVPIGQINVMGGAGIGLSGATTLTLTPVSSATSQSRLWMSFNGNGWNLVNDGPPVKATTASITQPVIIPGVSGAPVTVNVSGANTTYTALPQDDVLWASASGQTVVTLPAVASVFSGKVLRIGYNLGMPTGSLTVNAAAGDSFWAINTGALTQLTSIEIGPPASGSLNGQLLFIVQGGQWRLSNIGPAVKVVTNTAATLELAGTTAPPQLQMRVQSFITAGTFTYTPSPGLAYAIVECWGAGGGGSGVVANGGVAVGTAGSGGGYTRSFFSAAQIGASQQVTVGAGGLGGASGQAPTAGGSSSFGTLVVVQGGGAASNSSVGGALSSGSAFYVGQGRGGDLGFAFTSALTADAGQVATLAAIGGPSGAGSGSVYGRRLNTNNPGTSVAGTGGSTGAGGSGAITNGDTTTASGTTINGGNGGNGRVVVIEFGVATQGTTPWATSIGVTSGTVTAAALETDFTAPLTAPVTFDLPASPADGQIAVVSNTTGEDFTQGITIASTDGSTVTGNTTPTLTAGQSVTATYAAATNTWTVA